MLATSITPNPMQGGALRACNLSGTWNPTPVFEAVEFAINLVLTVYLPVAVVALKLKLLTGWAKQLLRAVGAFSIRRPSKLGNFILGF